MSIKNLEELQGEILTHVDADPEEDKILLTTKSGRQILLEHCPDCCERVWIESTNGDWVSLLGKPLELVSHEEEDASDSENCGDYSRTETTLTFKTDDATVVSKWIGESNGYYSESVDILELGKKGAK